MEKVIIFNGIVKKISKTPGMISVIAVFIFLFSFFFSGCGLIVEYEDLRVPDGYPGFSSEKEYPGKYKGKDTHIVREIVDGDTLILERGDRVRLLGINTPEYGTYFYREAGDVLRVLIEGKEVILEKDISDTDMYGRLLRYVYVGDIFVNLEMVRRGFANIFTCPPDLKFTKEFLEAECYSRENGLGLWERSDTGLVRVDVNYDAPGNDNENLNGEYVVMENKSGKILNTRGWNIKDSATNMYCFSHFNFIPNTTIRLFSGEGSDGHGYFYWDSPRSVWNNDHDSLYLRDREGLLIEVYSY